MAIRARNWASWSSSTRAIWRGSGGSMGIPRAYSLERGRRRVGQRSRRRDQRRFHPTLRCRRCLPCAVTLHECCGRARLEPGTPSASCGCLPVTPAAPSAGCGSLLGHPSPPCARCGSHRGNRIGPSAAAIPAYFGSSAPPSPTAPPASSTAVVPERRVDGRVFSARSCSPTSASVVEMKPAPLLNIAS